MRRLTFVVVMALILAGCSGKTSNDGEPGSAAPKPGPSEQEPESGGAKADAKKMQGEWTVEKFDREGKAFPEDRRKQMTFVVKGDKMMFKVGDRDEVSEFTLDPSQKPATIDMINPKSKSKSPGIYKLDGDTLTIVRIEEGGARPKSFEDANKEDTTHWVFKRKGK